MNTPRKDSIMTNRKEEIIQATLELAAEKGLGTVSMQQIANKVGITKASLYNHFSSKDEIIEAMYETLRSATSNQAKTNNIDYQKLVENHSLKEVLNIAVGSYHDMVSDPKLNTFYRIIMSERAINKSAAEIMVRETETMINETKTLFCVLYAKGKASFDNIDMAAFSFAMTIHSIIDYGFDLDSAGLNSNNNMIKDYIDEFCKLYEVKEDK